MSDITRLIPGRHDRGPDPFAGLVEGRVLKTLTSEKQGMRFVLRDFDEEANEWGPCPWMPRVIEVPEPDIGHVAQHVLPQAGDRVLVGFVPTGDGDHDPWVVAWWPVGDGYEETRL